jgi:hypothetical protein
MLIVQLRETKTKKFLANAGATSSPRTIELNDSKENQAKRVTKPLFATPCSTNYAVPRLASVETDEVATKTGKCESA